MFIPVIRNISKLSFVKLKCVKENEFERKYGTLKREGKHVIP
jgi:hypothetical protein